MGEKPLYFGQFGKTFAWASELKSLRQLENCPREIDPLAVADVLERGYVRGERCIFKNVHKLPPGAVLQVQAGSGIYQTAMEKYWSVDDVLARHSAAADRPREETSLEQLDSLLQMVIRDEMIADVPVGAFLSGGIDSSLVVAIMQRVASQPVKTFTIGFDSSEFDESHFARDVAAHLGTNHTEIQLSPGDALGFLDKLPGIFDEPFADSSQLPTLLVCQATRQFVTVALSGDGGDELFGGYSQYLNRDSIRAGIGMVPGFARKAVAAGVSVLPESAFEVLSKGGTWPQNVKARIAASLKADSPRVSHEGLLSAWANPASIMAPALRSHLAHRSVQVLWPSAPTFAESQMAYDMQTYLPDDILVKVDRSAMSVSLETRAPLLDHRVVEFALGQPASLKIEAATGKQLLRRLLDRYLPRSMWDRPKRGFAVPLAAWLRKDLAGWSQSLLKEDAILREWFQPQVVDRIWSEHARGKDHATRLWRVLILMQWLRTNA
jgi:asparagine synthase (glutamine-hydrolysing)